VPSGGADGGPGVANIISQPSGLAFGDVPINTTGGPKTTTIRNLGGASTPTLSVKLPPPTSSFAISADGCSGKILASGDSCAISVSFTPTVVGLASDRISVDAGGASGTDIILTGTGIAKSMPVLNLQPPQAAFGVVDVGSPSGVTFTVTNTGSASTSSLLVSNTGAPAFQIGSDQCSNRVLASNTSCTFVVNFAPTASGPASGTAMVKLPDGTMLVSGALTGTGRGYLTLTVQLQGSGSGTVMWGSGVTCPGTCTSQYPTTDPPGSTGGTTVTLKATPASNSTFGAWSGGGCEAVTGNVCTVVLNTSTNVTVTFSAPTKVHQVGRNVFGLAGHSGRLVATDPVLSCSTSCPPVPYPDGATVNFSAVPASGSTFVGWTEGPCRGTSTDCTLTINSDVIVSGTFGPQAYMFVTSTKVVPGNLGGVAGADAECMNRAAGLPGGGTYRAWLASSAGPGSSRVGSGGWVRVDGRPFARNVATLGASTNQVVFYPPRLDETGRDVGPGHAMVATGDLLTSAAGPCADYTVTTQDLVVGDAIAGSGTWAASQAMPSGCSQLLPLYCFRTDLTGDITPAPVPGRLVFITSSAFSPYVGIAKADGFCQSEALGRGLPSTTAFLALLATSTASAASRLNIGGAPWKRTDEVIAFHSPDDLANGNLLAPLGVTLGNQYGTFFYWSGAVSPRNPSSVGFSCQDWSSSSAIDQGLFGNANLSGGPEWFGDANTANKACNRTDVHLLCAEH
jgi:hypothetical protein